MFKLHLYSIKINQITKCDQGSTELLYLRLKTLKREED